MKMSLLNLLFWIFAIISIILLLKIILGFSPTLEQLFAVLIPGMIFKMWGVANELVKHSRNLEELNEKIRGIEEKTKRIERIDERTRRIENKLNGLTKI